MWAITPRSLLKKNLTYSSIFKVYFIKSFAASKTSLVLIKNRCRSSRSQMFFRIGVLKKFAMFTEKHLCWSLFLIKLQDFRCFPVNIAKLLRAAFFIEHLQYIFKKTLLNICYNNRCHSLYHSFSLVLLVVVICCALVFIRYHSLYDSLSLVVTWCTTRLSFYKGS